MTEQENTTTRLTAEEARRMAPATVPDEWLDKTDAAIKQAAESGAVLCCVPQEVLSHWDIKRYYIRPETPVQWEFIRHYERAGFRIFCPISADGVRRMEISWEGN